MSFGSNCVLTNGEEDAVPGLCSEKDDADDDGTNAVV